MNPARNVDVTCAAIWFYMLSGANITGVSLSGASIELEYNLVPLAGVVALLWFYYRFRTVNKWQKFPRDRIPSSAQGSPKLVEFLKEQSGHEVVSIRQLRKQPDGYKVRPNIALVEPTRTRNVFSRNSGIDDVFGSSGQEPTCAIAIFWMNCGPARSTT